MEERDKKIETLKRRLDEAAGDLETNAALMEDVHGELKKGTHNFYYGMHNDIIFVWECDVE